MLDSVFNSTSIPLLEQVVRFSEQRHKLLAGNVANIDTPGYKPRDLPVDQFKQALRDAVGARGQNAAVYSPSSSANASQQLENFFPPDLFQPATADAQNITFQDGNNRSVEHAMMELQKNAAMQRFAVEVITSQLNLLQTVVSERF